MSRDFEDPPAPERIEARVLAPGLSGTFRLDLANGCVRSISPIEPTGLLAPGSNFASGRESARDSLLESPQLLRLASEYVVVPGFVDGHTHLLGVGTARLRPDLSESRSKRDALERLAAWLAAHPGDDPVIAEGWDQSLWDDRHFPTRAEVDYVAGSRPVILRRVCGHIAVFGSAALARVGTDWANLDAETGLAREQLPLAVNRLLPLAPEKLAEAAAVAANVALSRGVTWAHEMGDARSFRAFAAAGASGRFPIRVSHYFRVEMLDAVCDTGMRAGFGDHRLRTAGIKIFLDGSFGGRTAALRGQYADGSGSGELLWSNQDLEDRLRRCSEADLPVALHAIGDRAILQAIDIVERLARRGVHPAAPGPRLEHAESLSPDLGARAIACGFFLSMQPNFTARWQGKGQLYEQALGVERARALNPYRSALEGGRLLFGSDTMPLDPVLGLLGATEHPDPSERLSGMEALAAYTSGGAAAVRAPFGPGRLEPGAPADFVVLRASSALVKMLSTDVNDGGRDDRGARTREAIDHASNRGNLGARGAGDRGAIDPGASGVESTWIDGICRFRAPRSIEVAG